MSFIILGTSVPQAGTATLVINVVSSVSPEGIPIQAIITRNRTTMTQRKGRRGTVKDGMGIGCQGLVGDRFSYGRLVDMMICDVALAGLGDLNGVP